MQAERKRDSEREKRYETYTILEEQPKVPNSPEHEYYLET